MRVDDGSLEALRERLLKGGVAPRRVKRYLGELDDHLAELIARELAAGYAPDEAKIRARALLGSDDQLAESWLADPRLKSLTARAPWAVLPVFLVLAVLFGFLTWIAAWVAIGFAYGVLGAHHHPPPAWFATLSALLSQTANFLTPLLGALVVTLLVWRQRLSPYWSLLPVPLLLLAGLRMAITVAPHSINLGFGASAPWSPDLQLPSLLYALHVALLVAPSLALMIWKFHRAKLA